jgi:hypothetical protein
MDLYIQVSARNIRLGSTRSVTNNHLGGIAQGNAAEFPFVFLDIG